MTGKTADAIYEKAIGDYIGRINHYLPLETYTIPSLKNTRSLTQSQQKEKEGELILKAIQAGDHCVLLDENGKMYSSKGFAAYMEGKMIAAPRRLVFVIGGPYGFSESVYAVSKERLALSPMTFSHQMIRLIFTEQLYRAFTILNHEPYHHS
jgi:23S rRNA (pseudouridine1915-N3)-methyltransferase